ncbi:MAG: yopX [Bacteroidetes bacterium]|jgi:uncharacterized phage protein (TIGR01671 family)|nr:yopX [Bacteroidota bacterium]
MEKREKKVRKYRAFDHDTGKMHYFHDQHEMGVCEGDWMIDFQGNIWERHGGTGGDFIVENVDLLEYTGHKDKYGILIFEGDIVKIQVPKDDNMGFDELKGKYIVEWAQVLSGFTLQTVDNKIAYSLYDTEDHFQVIGNVYENPEILKDVTELLNPLK